ncbi:Med5-domain-containing protein [Acaromyces ingoldii]|uniref:Mediator of RNA polymerase II transcription subunit 5 n=1 Tax=Acaromyces ingoldii TaxID=215250 RepID=A0A316YIZ3_9BASI|nr:Med5-domain-containing protein [Acaromyces ingoldii]PWN89161.1 Med5-domain-containing protein [Acaromyces ingoldii]
MADVTSFLDETEDVDALWTLIEVASGAIRHAVEHHLAPVSRLFTGVLSHVAISHQRLTKVSAQKSEAKEAASLALNTSIEAASKANAQEESLILRSIQTALRLSSQPQQETTAIEDPLQGSFQEKKKVAGGRSAMADALRLASASRPSWTSCCSLETIISGKIGGISGTSIPVDPEISNLLHLCVDQLTEMHIKVEAAKMLLGRRIKSKSADTTDDECRSTFYFEILYGATIACATIASTPPTLGGSEAYASVWRSALCGLVPEIIAALEANLEESTSTSARLSRALHALLVGASQVIEGCEVAIAQSEETKKRTGGDEDMEMMLDAFIGSDTPPRQAVRAALLRSLVELKLIEDGAWKSIPGAESVNEDWQLLSLSFQGEVYGTDQSLETLIEQRLSGGDDVQDLFDRIVSDYAAQEVFATTLLRLLEDWTDLEPLSRICRALTASPTALEVLLLYISPSQLLHPFATVLIRDDLAESGDEPSVLASILLFTQAIVQRGLLAGYQVEDLLGTEDHFLSTFTRSSSAVWSLSSLDASEQNLISRWVTALYDSDGISDELIRDSSPQFLLRMAPTLLSQSVHACISGVIDMDTLRGGLSYFLQDLLSFTLPGALRWLVSDIELITSSSLEGPFTPSKALSVRFDVLTTFILAESCPSTVLRLVSSDLQALLSRLALKNKASTDLSSSDNTQARLQQQWMTPELSSLKAKVESEVKTLPLQRTSLWIRAGPHQQGSHHQDLQQHHQQQQQQQRHPQSSSTPQSLLQPPPPPFDSMFGLYQGLLHATRVRGVASVVKRLVKAVDAQHPQGAPMPRPPPPPAAATMAIEKAAAGQGVDSERSMAMQGDTQAQNGGEEEEEREAPRRNRRRAACEVARAVEKLLALRLRRGIKGRERARALLATFLGAKEEGEEKGPVELVFAKALEQGRRVAVS